MGVGWALERNLIQLPASCRRPVSYPSFHTPPPPSLIRRPTFDFHPFSASCLRLLQPTLARNAPLPRNIPGVNAASVFSVPLGGLQTILPIFHPSPLLSSPPIHFLFFLFGFALVPLQTRSGPSVCFVSRPISDVTPCLFIRRTRQMLHRGRLLDIRTEQYSPFLKSGLANRAGEAGIEYRFAPRFRIQNPISNVSLPPITKFEGGSNLSIT